MKFLLIVLVIVLMAIHSNDGFRIKRQNDMIFFPDYDAMGPAVGPPIRQPQPNQIGNGGMPIQPEQNTTPASSTASRRTTPSPEFLRCMKQCPTTTEYNPVCGSDQVQYHNEQRLNCANNCGARVRFVRRGNCVGVLATNTVRFK